MQQVVVSGHFIMREWRAHSHGDQGGEDLVREGSNGRLHGPGEEFGEGERLTGIATEGCRLGGVEVGEDGLVESQVGPAGKEAEQGEPEGGSGE